MVRVAGESPRTARHIKLSPAGKEDPVILCCEMAGDGPPAVLIPGLGDTVWVWRRLIPFLQHHNLVTAVELRGHGRSASPFGPYSIPELADDIFALTQKLNLSRSTLVAQGFGGRVAMTLALKRPELVSGLVLISPHISPPVGDLRSALIERIDHAARGDMRAAYKSRKSQGREPRGMSPQERAEHHRIFIRNSPAGYTAACSAELNATDLTGKLEEIQCPVIAVVGELDSDRLEDAQQMTEKIADCETVIIEGAGHFVHLDRTETFHALLDHFLKTHNLSKIRS